MSWGTDTTDFLTPLSRTTRFAVMSTLLAGLVWVTANLVMVGVWLDRPGESLNTFLYGLSIVVFGTLGFVVILVPTLAGIRARSDVAGLGAAAFNAIPATIGGGWWLWGASGATDLADDLQITAQVTGIVLLLPAGVVAWAWREWSRS